MLFKPFAYLKIWHEEKFLYDFVIPIIVAIIFVILYLRDDFDISFIGDDGLVHQVNGLLGVLSGFYIAALTAIATFPSEHLDNVMSGKPPTLKIVKDGKTYSKDLTRREYLRYLYGYLALLSLILFFVGIIMSIFYMPISHFLNSNVLAYRAVSASIVVLYVFFLVNLVINTMIGIYYVSDRIHRAS